MAETGKSGGGQRKSARTTRSKGTTDGQTVDNQLVNDDALKRGTAGW